MITDSGPKNTLSVVLQNCMYVPSTLWRLHFFHRFSSHLVQKSARWPKNKTLLTPILSEKVGVPELGDFLINFPLSTFNMIERDLDKFKALVFSTLFVSIQGFTKILG